MRNYSQNYSTITIKEYLEKQLPDKFVIMRHDIGRCLRRHWIQQRSSRNLV